MSSAKYLSCNTSLLNLGSPLFHRRSIYCHPGLLLMKDTPLHISPAYSNIHVSRLQHSIMHHNVLIFVCKPFLSSKVQIRSPCLLKIKDTPVHFSPTMLNIHV
uniref:Uncharacterized protein n=1 Tax=Cacopsylla melanoneura TaxID=428564 RepID=A0A8D8S9C2_9HEMI